MQKRRMSNHVVVYLQLPEFSNWRDADVTKIICSIFFATYSNYLTFESRPNQKYHP